MRFDYTDCESETEAKRKARKDLVKLYWDFTVQTFGEENVRMVDKNKIGFVFGDAKDKDGFPCDFAAVIHPVPQNFEEHTGPKRTYPAYDLYQVADDFAAGIEK